MTLERNTPFTENLFRIRTKQGLTQAEIAKKIGITQAAYSKLERRPDTPQPRLIAKVAKALGVSTDTLLKRHAKKDVAEILATAKIPDSPQAVDVLKSLYAVVRGGVEGNQLPPKLAQKYWALSLANELRNVERFFEANGIGGAA